METIETYIKIAFTTLATIVTTVFGGWDLSLSVFIFLLLLIILQDYVRRIILNP